MRRLGLSPRKALGQHFLVDRDALAKVLEAAEVAPGDTVVEVGPGLGVLTQRLVALAGRVVAVELDAELVTALSRLFASQKHLQIVHGDARTVDLSPYLPGDRAYKVVGNLPYYVGTYIVRRFLEGTPKPSRIVAMLQKEVAESMAARPGRMSLLSVAVQFYAEPAVVGYVPPLAFYPPPKVTSAIVRLDVRARPAVDVDDVERFFALVRAGFSAPRKQLGGVLRHALALPASDVGGLLAAAGVDPRRRAETLSLEEWGALFRACRQADSATFPNNPSDTAP
ncbi:MAG: ribosomal RNA small subunit methyltransferase A [Chloroflexi bacterium]|nr:ribosomal RNA small subunit methyltransferase A [Chloroflexota bacterium]